MLRERAVRHADGVALLVGAVSLIGFVTYLAMERSHGDAGGLGDAGFVFAACQLLPFGLVGAVLVAKRPDLPFGWLLSAGAAALVLQLAVIAPSYAALEAGHTSEVAVWGLGVGALGFVPFALEGVINVRFPSGRAQGRGARVLDRVLIWGILAVVLGSMFGDSTQRSIFPEGLPGNADRVIDGTPLVEIGNAVAIGVPVLILLGVVAGIGVVVRCVRSEGVERKQLRWRAAGVLGALALFPLAVTETLPAWLTAVEPLLFVTTLVVPVLRYDLWAIDSLIRRSAAYTLTAPGSAVDNVLRSTAEMLRLPYVAVRRDGQIFAAHGKPDDTVTSWPMRHAGQPVGELLAAPRRGLPTLDQSDRHVLAAVAELLAGSVSAAALTADLLAARHQLVAAREEERRRLRRDLHDGLGPLLTGLGLNLDAAQAHLEQDPLRAAPYLKHAKDASGEVITSLRSLVYGLRPPALDDLGFVGAIRLQVDRISRDAGLACELDLPDELDLPAAVEVAAFRAIIESVTNAARHSDATRLTIEARIERAHLKVKVSDNGTPSGQWKVGVGLTGLRERVEELGGRFTATSTSSGGVVTATYPLAEARR